MPNTNYTVKVNGEVTETRSRKGKAIELAEQALATDPQAEVTVTTDAGTQVWPEVEAEATETEATESNRSKPGTRTEAPEFPIETPEGYEPAYIRPRVLTVVFRHVTEKGDYLVRQADTDGRTVLTEPATNTTEARAITNRLAEEHRVAVAEAKEAEKARKQAEKDRKAAEKAEALARKEAEAAETEQPAEAELVEA